MKNLKLKAPWQTFHKKINALFGQDPDIVIGGIYKPEDGHANYAFDMAVKDGEKFAALDRLLPNKHVFGITTLEICMKDGEGRDKSAERIGLYATAFRGNPVVKDFKNVDDMFGCRHGYVRFWPEVLQFFHDDLTDYNGNWSGLAQDIAREIFADDACGICFCTAPVNENDGGEVL